MNKSLGLLSAMLILLSVLACDSPPWSRCIIANNSGSEITVRFYQKFPTMAAPYLYSPEEWAEGEHFYSGTPKDKFKINDVEKYTEVVVVPNAAIEIDSGRYPDIEKNTEGNFLIDRIEISGASGDLSWNGKTEVFGKLNKEGGDISWILGRSPRYVFYYK